MFQKLTATCDVRDATCEKYGLSISQHGRLVTVYKKRSSEDTKL